MSNYEHIFELAIDCIKSGEDFDDFLANTAVRDNVNAIFECDCATTRYKITNSTLHGIWDIANYVYSEYMRNCPFFKEGCSNANTYLCADCKFGEYYD